MSSAPADSHDSQPAVDSHDEDSLLKQLEQWIRERAPWWVSSFTVHMLGLSVLLLLGRVMIAKPEGKAPSFVEANTTPPETIEVESPPDMTKVVIDPPPEIDFDVKNIVPPGNPDSRNEGPPSVPPPGDNLVNAQSGLNSSRRPMDSEAGRTGTTGKASAWNTRTWRSVKWLPASTLHR